MPKQEMPGCSFCGKSSAEVRKLIAGPGVFICDSCVFVCGRILAKELPDAGAPPPRKSSIVFQTDAAETQASRKILKEMKRDKAISEDEYIALSRRLIADFSDGKISTNKTSPAPRKRAKEAEK